MLISLGILLDIIAPSVITLSILLMPFVGSMSIPVSTWPTSIINGVPVRTVSVAQLLGAPLDATFNALCIALMNIRNLVSTLPIVKLAAVIASLVGPPVIAPATVIGSIIPLTNVGARKNTSFITLPIITLSPTAPIVIIPSGIGNELIVGASVGIAFIAGPAFPAPLVIVAIAADFGMRPVITTVLLLTGRAPIGITSLVASVYVASTAFADVGSVTVILTAAAVVNLVAISAVVIPVAALRLELL